MSKILRLFSVTLLASFSLSIAAATVSQIEAVQDAAEKHVADIISVPKNGKIDITAGNLDSRMRLTDCPVPLDTDVPGRQQLNTSVTVMVSCDQDNWQVYIPVKIELMTPSVVAKRPLNRGMTIASNDLAIQMVNSRFQRGRTYTQPARLIGSKVKRTVGMGEPISSSDVCAVCRNDDVLITAQGNGLNIVAKGTALSDGALGEQIKVKNNKSKRLVDATISAVGEVTVNF
ncbi:flagella basal body P-ring formation protein FlgA [Salinivibrio sp. MA427]|jgi:flagella basal body P-ring formation protein FlgA|uniref:Flagella basal body P-ring formation protein FlgA n=1 Tax=Salinivibrio costicola subsp. alcaliphilus TaxID=272773 RepID=A0ABX3KV58_SALCS|nr:MULTISPECIES: flagellar basal body P-ring formation chaperone FlgA [Salinivibrio]OOE93232.1 flagella basal body P-ring formation protein FlgA [Salinivibrio sp. AR647]OOE93534.1 flagella basal body P-ring formation protein FlgA [Salinivibrio sp. AR640]OOF04858.1 flagella basal body P-ring formation protein FlgA [Salinivibrio sp. MA607]OOF07539.1 flagella basal body P-ring formation protein FlgA [Salinivibrio sp. MA440]OOF19087.1 flagella basal body P-ring formation protein FlgA [Salinivibrio